MTAFLLLVLRLALVAALYFFLAWIFITLWTDLRQRGQLLSNHLIPMIALVPVTRPEQERLTYRSVQLTLGRNPTCDAVLDDETVSAYHARLNHRQNQWWVEDLQSTNGTFLNGLRLSTPTVLTTGDQLRLGQLSYLVIIGEGHLDGQLDILQHQGAAPHKKGR